MDANRDEVAEFGRAADAGRNQDIEPGGTLVGGHGDHGGHPDDEEEQSRRRKPPQGRSHAAV